MAQDDTDDDTALIDRLDAELRRGAMSSTASLFADAGAPSPIVIWSPRSRDVRHPVLANLFRVI